LRYRSFAAIRSVISTYKAAKQFVKETPSRFTLLYGQRLRLLGASVYTDAALLPRKDESRVQNLDEALRDLGCERPGRRSLPFLFERATGS
jgi:hypothetical protein